MRRYILIWTCVCLIDPTYLYAGNLITYLEGHFKMEIERNGVKTKAYVLYNSESSPVWEISEIRDGGILAGNDLNYWSLLDAANQGDNISILLGTGTDDLFWVKTSRQKNGAWKVDFAKRLHGVASAKFGTQQIRLNGVDEVVIGNRNTVVTYTMNKSGIVLKNGAVFDDGWSKLK